MSRSRGWGFILLVGVVLLGAAYAAYWYWLTGRVEASVNAWAADRRAEGYRVDFASMTKVGFPFRAEVRLAKPMVSHSDQGVDWRWQSEELFVAAPLFQFDHLSLRAPSPSRAVIQPGGGANDSRAAIPTTIVTAEAETRLGYDDGGITSVSSTSRDIVVSQKGAEKPIRIGSLYVEAQPDSNTTRGIERALGLRAERVHLAEFANSPLGGEVAVFRATGTLQGPFPDAPLRRAVIAWRNEGGVLDLTGLQVIWGAVRMKGSGTLALDEALRPIGAFALRVAGYNWLLNQFVAREQLNRADADLARAMLAALAQQEGNGDGVPVPLRIQNGRVWFGPKAIAHVHPIL